MKNKSYRYYALITYSHKDEREAKWLQRKLESYKLSTVLQKQNDDFPKKIKIFLDKTDVSWSAKNSISNELKEAKNLIVICSPESAKSEYVDREIESFIKIQESADNIFPFAVKGRIKKGAENDCFTPSLHNNNLNAIEVRELGRHNAFIRLLASLLGLKYDDLKQREKWRQLRKISSISAGILAIVAGFMIFVPNALKIAFLTKIGIYAASGLFALAIGSLFFWNAKLRITFKYYVDYVDKKGKPKGIHPLRKKEIRHRQRHYRFEYRGGKLRSVVCANSAGKPIQHTESEFKNRPIVQEINYNDKGKLQGIFFKDKNDKILLEIDFGKFYRRANLKGETTDSQSLVSSVTPLDKQKRKSSITSYSYKRNRKGYITQQLFSMYHDANVPAKDFEGAFGFEYKLNDNGQINKLWYLDENAKHLCKKNGIAGKVYKYDEKGDLSEITYINKNGKPSLNENFWAIKKYERDKWGNIIEETYYGIDGKPVLHKNGYALLKQKFNEQGQLVEGAHYGVDGEPAFYKDGFSIIKWKYDEHGNLVETSYYDINGKPVLNIHGYAIVRSKYDKYGNIIEQSVYGIDGNLIIGNKGYATVRFNYNEQRKIIGVSLYGVNGEPIEIKS